MIKKINKNNLYEENLKQHDSIINFEFKTSI